MFFSRKELFGKKVSFKKRGKPYNKVVNRNGYP
jgi:hypothetical protein